EALEIAEAGLNYYRWHLAHDPNDLQDGTGGPGPYVHQYSDPESGVIGSFSLDITGKQNCGFTSGVTITSTGWTDEHSDIERTVQAKYVRSTVADFSYLINDNVWAGADREIKGPYHSNGGIRMDGENNSLVTSARETWWCTSAFGCSPAQEQPGVFGAGENSDLWRFPVPVFDFDGITIDLAQIKGLTQGGQGLYFGPSGKEGYHILLKADRSMDVYEINSLSSVQAYDSEQGWHTEYSVINSESFLGNYNIPGDCGLVFMEDNLWVGDLNEESKVKGKVTIVSADLINPGIETNIWLDGSIEYTVKDGSDGLVLMSQNNNLIGLYVPDNMALEGVFLAQTGHFGRNYYSSSYSPYYKRQKLEMYGSVVSNGRVGTKWSCSGIYCSGFKKRENTYDPGLSFNPPPFLPATTEKFEFKEWEEVE
ncbi:MAG: hypothetical protein ACE5D6_08425, partial [Candidatus Zixiibacteriota bacterium]